MAKVEGLQKLKAKINALPKVVREQIKKDLIESAEDLTRLQKRLAPTKTGKLRDSITFTQDPSKVPKFAALKSGAREPNEISVLVTAGDSSVRYAHLVEFGTKPHIVGGRFAGAQHPGTPPRPFFYPPFRAKKKSIKSKISRGITKAVKQVASR